MAYHNIPDIIKPISDTKDRHPPALSWRCLYDDTWLVTNKTTGSWIILYLDDMDDHYKLALKTLILPY